MRIIFAGTPEFAAEALRALVAEGHDVALVLTQPDRPSGRGMKLTASPVKRLAEESGIPVLTPETLSLKRDPEGASRIHQQLRDVGADLLVVAAYGLILPQPVLDCAKGIGADGDIRALNIHASILPRWRGAAPIARAIEAGDLETGVTLMKMEAGLDTGPMIETVTTLITPDDTTELLTERLAHLGAAALVEALRRPDTLRWKAQPEDGVTYAEKLLKTESRIDWNLSAAVLERRLRAFTPFPGLAFERDDVPVKIWSARLEPQATHAPAGTVLEASPEGLVVACGEGALRALILQKPGKPRMQVGPFLQSLPVKAGEVLS